MLSRAVYPIPAESLPLQMETIGINPDQEPIIRPDGYPCFHWLQTLEGEGELVVQGKSHKLPERSGVLLHPNIEHSYSAKSSVVWKTVYVPFTGTQAASLVIELLGGLSEKIQWDRGDDEISVQSERILHLAASGADPSG